MSMIDTGTRLRVVGFLLLFGALMLALSLASVPTVSAAEDDQIAAGKLLVASSEIQDARFFQAVVYLVKHDSEGTLGLIINRPIAHGPVDDLLKGIGAETTGSHVEITIHYGGPVSSGRGFLLHTDDKMLDSSLSSAEGLAMTSDARMIQAIAAGTGPRLFLFTLGYAGWAPGQLEQEVKAKSWFVIPTDEALIFDQDAAGKWRRALDKRRIRL